jgi:hypothetical protein
MTRATTRRGWLILAACAAGAAAVLTIGLPASGAGADRGHAACDASHGLHLGWQHGHDPRHPPGNESVCPPTVPATAPSDSAAPAAPGAPAASTPSLTRIPAAGTVLTLSAEPASPTPSSSRATTSTREQRHRIEVAPHAATTANASPVLTAAVFAFTLAVSGIVFVAGRRTGRRIG